MDLNKRLLNLTFISSIKGLLSFFFLCLIGITCHSCLDDNPLVVASIDTNDEFEIDIFQDLEAPQTNLFLRISTIQDLDCDNFSINTTVNQNEDEIDIFLNNIESSEECTNEPGPASTIIPIDISTLGEKTLRIIFTDEIIDEGTLINTPSNVELSFSSNHGIKSYISSLQKILANSLIAVIEFEEEILPAQIETFITELYELAEPLHLSDGYYGHFIVENGMVSSKDASTNSLGIPLNITALNSEELESLLNIIETNTNSFENDGIFISLFLNNL